MVVWLRILCGCKDDIMNKVTQT